MERIEVQELDVARQRWTRGEFQRTAYWRVFTPRRAVEIIELTLNRVSVGRQFMDRAADVFDLAAGKLRIALLRRGCDEFLSLLDSQRMIERVAVGGAHGAGLSDACMIDTPGALPAASEKRPCRKSWLVGGAEQRPIAIQQSRR